MALPAVVDFGKPIDGLALCTGPAVERALTLWKSGENVLTDKQAIKGRNLDFGENLGARRHVAGSEAS